MLQSVLLFLNLSFGEIFIVLIVILLFFGSKSIPTMARTFGRAVRKFRDASQEIQREIRDNTDDVQKKVNKEVREFRDQVDIRKEIED